MQNNFSLPFRTIFLEAALMCHSNRSHSRITGPIVLLQKSAVRVEAIFDVLPAFEATINAH